MQSNSRYGWWSIAARASVFFWRSHVAVAFGVAAATAVIVGALVVGDSVRNSLRGLVLDRLGNIQSILHARTYFHPDILRSIQSASSTSSSGPAFLILAATVEKRSGSNVNRATQVQLIGVEASFWKNAPNKHLDTMPADLDVDEIAINEGLAKELALDIGDEITVRFERHTAVPADSPLGRRDDPPISIPRQKVKHILPDDSIGGLSLRTTQSVTKNIYFSLKSLQQAAELDDVVNAAWIADGNARTISDGTWCGQLDTTLRPGLEDLGFQLKRHTLRHPTNQDGKLIYDYYQLSSKDLILDGDSMRALNGIQPPPTRVMAYLANAIYRMGENGEPDKTSEVPYSIVAGVDAGGDLNLDSYTTLPQEDIRGKPCWINSWLADRLGAKAGDRIQVNYYIPETVDGREIESTFTAIVAGIVPISEPQRVRNREYQFVAPPTIFNDPNITPEVPGVTDQDSISKWDVPFEMDRKVKKEDDDYWNRHGLTPKLFLRYEDASGLNLFGSRFGRTTSLRFASASNIDEIQLRKALESALTAIRPSRGMNFQPIRQQQLQAASGTTPFDMLFLSLSFFVIVSALLLVSLLFRLSIYQRQSQVGMMLSQGFTSPAIRNLLIRELTIVISGGALMGTLLGLIYARAMLFALQTWWIGAISVAFLKFHFTLQSLLVGALVGGLCSLATIFFTLRKLTRQTPLLLIRHQYDEQTIAARPAHRAVLGVAILCVASSLGLTIFAFTLTGMPRAGCFFGSGMALLTGALLAFQEGFASRGALRPNPSRANLSWLAWLAICRNPVRSALSLGLIAVATFLITSMGLFQLAPDSRGYGGFDLIGESTQPIYRNVASREIQDEILGNKSQTLSNTTILPLRARLRDDASCNNLFQTPEPTVLGVPQGMQQIQAESAIEDQFEWAASLDSQNPWKALSVTATGRSDSPIPVILDMNTAAWSLHQGAALGAITKLQFNNEEVFFRTVGLLSNSVLQGKLLIGEANFQALFPKQSGYQFFLIRSGGQSNNVSETMESGWGDSGMDVVQSESVLRRMLSVQNTYISAFQSLGALGLLLGTIGLAAVQVRSVMERRRELAMMRAFGFQNGRIAGQLMFETLLLLGGGMLTGIMAAAIAVIPNIANTDISSFGQTLTMLIAVLITGILAGVLAIRAALRLPILSSLRSE